MSRLFFNFTQFVILQYQFCNFRLGTVRSESWFKARLSDSQAEPKEEEIVLSIDRLHNRKIDTR